MMNIQKMLLELGSLHTHAQRLLHADLEQASIAYVSRDALWLRSKQRHTVILLVSNMYLGATTADKIKQGLQGASLEGRQRSGAVVLGGCVKYPSCRRCNGHVRSRAQQLYYLHRDSKVSYSFEKCKWRSISSSTAGSHILRTTLDMAWQALEWQSCSGHAE